MIRSVRRRVVSGSRSTSVASHSAVAAIVKPIAITAKMCSAARRVRASGAMALPTPEPMRNTAKTIDAASTGWPENRITRWSTAISIKR